MVAYEVPFKMSGMTTASKSARVMFNLSACALVISTLDMTAALGTAITLLSGELRTNNLEYHGLKKSKVNYLNPLIQNINLFLR
jgi:hypothetical protein